MKHGSPTRLRRFTRPSLALLPAVFAAVLLAGSQTPARAGLLDDLLSGPGGVAGPVVGGIGGVTCEQAGDLPVLGQGFCLLKSAHIKYRTTYLRPDGTELVRSVNALVALPSIINADDDLLPEMTATLAIKSTNTFTLKVERVALETGVVPVKFEVIAPLPGDDPKRESVFIGYDARQGRMPNRWNGRIVLVENTETRTRLGVEVTRSGAAPRLKLIGGLFDGGIGSRVDPIAATIDPQPVPETIAATLLLVDEPVAGKELEIGASASSPTSVSATLENVEGPVRQDVTAFIKDLPATPTKVRVLTPTDTEQHVYYSAEKRMPEVRFTSEDRKAGVLTDRLDVRLDDIPEQLEFHQPRPGVGNVATTGGPVGKTRVTINDGRFISFPVASGPHVSYLYDGVLGAVLPPDTHVPNQLDLEIDRLTAASFDTTHDFGVDVTTAGQPRQTLSGHVEDQLSIVQATVHQIPEHVNVLATETGEIHYNGFGQTVPQINAHVEAKNGTLSEESRYALLDATILDLPAAVDVAMSPDKNHIVADAGEGVGSLRVHARDRVSSCQADLGTDRGAAVVDTPAHACLAARFDGLRSADVQVEPLKVDVKSNQTQDLVIRASLDEAGDEVNTIGHLDGTITQMPSEFNFAVLPGTSTLGSTTKHYRLRSNDPTTYLSLKGTNLPESFGNGFLEFKITQLPREIDAYLPDEGKFRSFNLEAPDGIGKAELELSKKQTPCLAQITEESGVAFADTATEKCIGVRISGVKNATLELYPLNLSTRTAAQQKFQIKAAIDDLEDDVQGAGIISATIDKLPTELDIVGSTGTVPDAPNSSTMNLAIDLREKIDSLDFHGSNLPSTFPARFMDIVVEDVWDETTVKLPKDGDVAALQVTTLAGPLKLVRVQLNNDNIPIALDEDGDNVVVDDGKFAVLVHDLKRAQFQSRLGEGIQYDGTLLATITHAQEAKPLHVKVDDLADHITVDIPDPPSYLSFRREGTYSPDSFTPDRPAMIYLDGGVPQVTLHIGEDNVSSIDLEAREIPDGLKFCVWSGGGEDYQWRISDVHTVDPTWCYRPEKKPLTQGGDPFTVFDTVQFKLSVDNDYLEQPVLLDKLVLKSKDSEGAGTTTVTQGKVGLIDFAYGQGTIRGDWTEAGLALYGGDDDNPDWEGVYDTDPENRDGLHFYANTDQHGFAAKLDYAWNPNGNGDDDIETTQLFSLKPLVAQNKITVLDMTGAPGEVYQRGAIGDCSRTWDLFKLVFPSGVTIVPETLADLLNCHLEPVSP